MDKRISAICISVGDELLYGQTLDTNAHHISKELDKIGVLVKQRLTISDQEQEILDTIEYAESRAEIVLITGGLGPTDDDKTMQCLAKYFDSDIIEDQEVLNHLKKRFAQRNREMNALNKSQAMVPEKCTPIHNEYGTAPGMWFHERGKVFVSMPGVPKEMEYMLEEVVIPKIKDTFPLPAIVHKIVKTSGIPESNLAEKIKDWEDNLPDELKLAYLPSINQVKIRLTAVGEDKDRLEKMIQAEFDKIRPQLEKYIYGEDKDELNEVVGKLLKEQQKTIACAESCTGGYLSHMITAIPGSSNYFQGSIIPYHNEWKIQKLGVEEAVINENGAVSEECVKQMAEGVRKLYSTSIGVATSGIAGPGGGTEEKPVGTVWIALADGKRTKTKLLNLAFNRTTNIEITAISVLNLVRQSLQAK